ncbi:flavodoxin family protein [bacterium]|nr:flavodoxin family protein [bacterium]
MTRVIAVAGSPRPDANSDLLLTAFVRGAELAGGTVEIVVLRGLSIAPCDDCGPCEAAGRCKIGDDHPPLAERIQEADVFALASPVYWSGYPGSTKNFIDRFQGYWARRYILEWPDRPTPGPDGYLLAVGGARSFKNFFGMNHAFHFLMQTLYGRAVERLNVPQVDSRGDILKHPNALRKAFELGWRSVERAEARHAHHGGNHE